MSIADKLTYLQTTKQLLKTEINKINNVLTDNSTFRSYPQELFNGYLDILNNGTDTLWSNLEKVSASGEEATLENVETAPMKMVLNGNTNQETTSGKNLIAPNNLTETTVSGVTFTPIYEGKKLKYINVNGTSTSLISYDVSTIPLTLQAGTYFLSGCPTGGGNSTYELGLRYASFPRDLGNGVVLNLSAEATYSNCRIVIQNGVTVNNQKFYPMLEKSSTATSYEPYTGGQPSPNPDYPQQVKVVKGENVVSVHGKNLFDIDTITKNKTIDLNTGKVDVDTNDRDTSDFILVTNSVTYSCNVTMTRIAFYDENKNFISARISTTSVVTPDNCKYIRFSYDNTLTNIQFETGLSTEFTPYAKTYSISLGTLELCKINTYKDYFHKDSGKWYVHKEIGKKIVDENSSIATYSAPRFKIYGINFVSPSATEKADILCDKLRTVTKNALASADNVISGSDSGRTGEMLVRINAEINTLDLFKQFLAENNLTIYYHLATPTEEEITNTTLIEQLEAISNAKSVKDKTYITQTNEELPFILDVEAIKEYEVN